MYIFVSNKLFGQLFDISPENFIFLKTFNSKFPYSELWFADRNSKPLEIKDKVNITLVINESVKYKKDALSSSTWKSNIRERLWIFVFC